MKEQANINMDAASFDAIAKLAYGESGLQLAAEKSSMIQSRLRHRLRALNIESFEQYSAFVCSEEGRPERREMISALTTNVSHFFRENHHFEMLRSSLETDLVPQLNAGGTIRIWSAGCSNGQEALSIAMTILETGVDTERNDIRILATDIDPKVVSFANESSYPERLVSGIPDGLLKKYFVVEKSNAASEKQFRATEKLRKLITFKELNLMSNWPMKQSMDLIFCRNVVIYFDLDTQNRLWPRFHKLLKPGGQLFLGHSERISDPNLVGFQPNGPTAYKRATVNEPHRSRLEG